MAEPKDIQKGKKALRFRVSAKMRRLVGNTSVGTRNCGLHTEPIVEAPVHSTAEGASNYRVNMREVELELFTGNTSSY